MPRSAAESIRHSIESHGLVPVLRARSGRDAEALVDAMVAGGVRIVEVTMTIPGAASVLRSLRRRFREEDLLLGSGTVTTEADCAETIDAGASFVVSPSLHLDVIARTRALGAVSIPGALTPTEAITAWRAGADYVKVFPCSAIGGASYLKALKAPFPELRLIPTGGVTLSTATAFLAAGASALGVGSDLANPAALEENRLEDVTDTARQYLARIEEFRRTRS